MTQELQNIMSNLDRHINLSEPSIKMISEALEKAYECGVNAVADSLVKCETRKNKQLKKALIDKASEWIISRAAPEEKDIIAKEFRKAMDVSEMDYDDIHQWISNNDRIPQDGQLIAYAYNTGEDYLYGTIYYPEPPLTDLMDFWMPIEEIKNE